jgi:hypothetical protein
MHLSVTWLVFASYLPRGAPLSDPHQKLNNGIDSTRYSTKFYVASRAEPPRLVVGIKLFVDVNNHDGANVRRA